MAVAADGLTSRMIQNAQYLSVTDPPITPVPAGYTGRAAVSKKERPGGLPLATAYTRPFRQRLIGGRYSGNKTSEDGVRRSPVNIVSHCVRAIPPNTPSVRSQ